MLTPLRYLALGDSYTIGEAVARDECFPYQLAAQLRAGGLPIREPEIIARTGWTTDELAAALQTFAPPVVFDFVTLLIGVNNQYRGRDPENYRVEFAMLLERAITYAGSTSARVIVLSIPDWGVTPFARGQQGVSAAIDAYNVVNRAETLARGAQYVDITGSSRRAQRDATLLARDTLHPSAKMYAEWVRQLAPLARELLQVSHT